MRTFLGLEQFLSGTLWRTDLSSRGGPVRLGLGALRLAVVIVHAARDASLNLRAMGLVYNTLLSLVPLLAVSFSVLTAFGAHNRIEPVLAQALEPLGPKGAEITARVVDFVNNMRVGVLGAVGVAGLFYTVLSLIDRIEGSLNHIWQVRRPRAFTRKFTDYLSILLVGPVLVFAALAVFASARSHWLVQRVMEASPLQTLLVFVIGQVVPFLFLCGAFAFLYAVGPNTYVQTTSALVGGAAAGALWQLAGVAFAAFIAGSTRYAAIYSGFAALVVFLIWLYVAWLVLLIGGQVAYFHQYPASFLALRSRQGTSFRERVALLALAEIARRHVSGAPPVQIRALAAAIAAPVPVLEALIDDFTHRGVLLRSAEPEGIALARAPELVSVAEVLGVVRDPDDADLGAPAIALGPVNDVLQARDRAVWDAVHGVTLRSLVSPDALPEVVGAGALSVPR